LVGPSARTLARVKTGDQRLDQILLDGARDLRMRQESGLCLGEAADLRLQAPQACHIARGWMQDFSLRSQRQGLSGESPTILFELHWVQRYYVPHEGARR